MVLCLAGGVWHGLPQSAQAAETVAYCACVQCLTGPADITGDCRSVVDTAVATVERQVAPSRLYAGLYKSVLGYESRRFVRSVSWVKGHQLDSPAAGVLEAAEYVRARGNDFADKAADRGALFHPSPADEVRAAADLLVENLRLVLELVTQALPLWPPLPRGMPRKPIEARVLSHTLLVCHDWIKVVNGWWRCSACWRSARAGCPEAIAKRDEEECPGEAPCVLRGHPSHLWGYADAGGEPLAICLACGCYVARRLTSVASAQCRRRVPQSRIGAYRRVERGLHPSCMPGRSDLRLSWW